MRHALRFSSLSVLALGLACTRSSQPQQAAVSRPSPPVERAPHEHAATATASAPLTLQQIAEGAFLLPDLGDHHRAITTKSAEAQTYFDQGLRLTYAFNHDEAARSFARAAELDDRCASCYWGVALVLGPNYNVPMLANRFPAAWTALERARALASSASPVEQALIGALAKRYPGPEPKDPPAMQAFNEAYAAAMTDVARQFPEDLDVQVLRAEALMDLRPWKLWGADGKPAPGTQDIVATLERVLAKDERHPGANHYYIHAIEPSPNPERALASAERLASLIPGAGHIVHMPAHIYQRVGRYGDASAHNRNAAELDRRYMPRAPRWGYYGMYYVHNYGFLSYSASMEGRSEESLAAAKQAASNFPPAMLAMMPGMDFFISGPLLAMVRFGKFDDILAYPRPDPKYPTLTSLWLHAHGLAMVAKGRLEQARADHDELHRMGSRISTEASTGTNLNRDVVAVSAAILDAAIAQKQQDPRAFELWEQAVRAEDSLSYAEPADWFYPVRHYQGAALLETRRWKDAEAVYRADLAKNPRNGWALWGLAQALRGAGRTSEAAAVERDFEKAWARADIELTTTAFL